MDRIPRAPQPPGRYVEVFTEAEVAALTSLDDLRDRALMTVLVDAGLRKGEARNLCAGRCLLEARQFVVVGGKGGKDRVIPMGERLASVLADLFLTDGVEPDSSSVRARREPARSYERQPLEGDRRGHLPPLVGAFARRGRRSLPQSAHRPSHVRHAVAAARRAHGDALEGDGPRLDRHDRRPLRTP